MTIKLRKKSLFPALVTAESPLTLQKNGAVYDFGLSIDALRSSLDPIYTPSISLGVPLTPVEFGALGNGTTDDTSALQAWAASISAGKGRGSLGGRTYRTTASISLGNDTYIEGPGTIAYEGTGNALVFTGKSRITLKNFTLTGNAVVGVFTSGNMGMFAQDLTVGVGVLTINYSDDIHIEGLNISGFADTAIYGGWWHRAKIINNTFGAVGFSHVTVLSPEDILIDGNILSNLSVGSGFNGVSVFVSRSATSPMLSLTDSPKPKRVKINGNSFSNILTHTAIDAHSGEDMTISGNITRLVQKGINIEHHTTRGTTGALGTTTTVHLGSGAVQINDYYNGMKIIPTSGALAGVERTISDYDGTTRVATVSVAWASAPASGITFNLYETTADATKSTGPVVHNLVISGNDLSGIEASSDCDFGIAVETRTAQGFITNDYDICTGVVISNNVIRHHGMPASGGVFDVDGAAIVLRNVRQPVISNNSLPAVYGRAICVSESVAGAVISGNVAKNISQTQSTNVMIDLKEAGSSAYCHNNLCDSQSTSLFKCVAGTTSTDGLFVGSGNVARGISSALFSGTSRANAKGIRPGPSGPYFISDGAASTALTGTTSETTLKTITIPANTLGVSGTLVIRVALSLTNNANGKTLRVRFGGTQFLSLSVSSFASHNSETRIQNRNATNSQIAPPNISTIWGGTTSAVVTGSVDTTLDQAITITGQLTNAADSFTVESVIVEVIPTPAS